MLLLPTPTRITRTPGQTSLPYAPSVHAPTETHPTIRLFTRLAVAASPLEAWCRVVTAADLAPGAYRLSIRASTVPGVPACEIRASDAAGMRSGIATLGQLVELHRVRISCMEIEDAPGFPTRGIMLDVSRCRIPTMQSLFETVDLLARLKFNHLQLYTEHTFAFAAHEPVWSGWSPLTSDEIRRLDLYCSERGIELAANQNCFGHLAHWLKMPRYAHLAETHGDWVFDVWPRKGPFSLCPTNPDSLVFVRELLTELCPNFTSPLLNIGCDETYDVGFGHSKDAVAARGRARVYAEFVSNICTVAASLGKRPAFWSDIALHDASALDHLPRSLIALCWGYEADSPFTDWVNTCRSRGLESWVCPGTSTWCSITGRSSEAMQNIVRAAQEGHAAGATGFLLTDWGDRGHHQTFPLLLNMLGLASQAAWAPARCEALDPIAISRHVLRGPDGLSQWIFDIGNADQELRDICGPLTRPNDPNPHLHNQSALFADMYKPLNEAATTGPLALWHDTRDRLAHLAQTLPRGLRPLMREELHQTLDGALWATDRAILRRSAHGEPQRAELRRRLDLLVATHRRLWPIRSRGGGLEQSCGFYAALRELL